MKISSSIDEFIYSQSGDVIRLLEQREKEKRANVGRGFDSVNEVKNYMEVLRNE